MARGLGQYGLAYLHVVENDFAGSSSTQTFDRRRLRQAFGGRYLANGGYDRERASEALSSGAADLLSFRVPFLANPDLPARFAQGAPLNVADPSTFYGGDEKGYTDYPFLSPKRATAA